MTSSSQKFTVAAEQAQKTLAALLRQWLPGQTWTQVRGLVASQRVCINGELWLDDVRRLTGWALLIADDLRVTPAPSADEISALRELQAVSDVRLLG